VQQTNLALTKKISPYSQRCESKRQYDGNSTRVT
jgi:hypothetical protein